MSQSGNVHKSSVNVWANVSSCLYIVCNYSANLLSQCALHAWLIPTSFCGFMLHDYTVTTHNCLNINTFFGGHNKLLIIKNVFCWKDKYVCHWWNQSTSNQAENLYISFLYTIRGNYNYNNVKFTFLVLKCSRFLEILDEFVDQFPGFGWHHINVG